MLYPTPRYSQLKSEDFQYVYEPAEDTFLLLDALEGDASGLVKQSPAICLEVGSGSGLVIAFLASILGPSACYLASDINALAASCTERTSAENGVQTLTCVDDMVRSMSQRLEGMVDVLLFNPPYVVTPSSEVGGCALSASWAGGTDGREVIDRFLPVASRLLSSSGVLYLLVLQDNKPDELIAIMERLGFDSRIVARRQAGREKLYVIKFFAKMAR